MAKKNSVYYSVPWDLVKDVEPDRHECQTSLSVDEASWRDLIAEECAEDYHANHDGWEASWPLTILLYESEEGPEVCRFHVDRESRPVFSAFAA